MKGYSLTYIFHDCFVYEDEAVVIVFDFWKDPLDNGNAENPPLLDLFKVDKAKYVVVSHHHKDHFTRRIFLWQKMFPDLNYIVSADVYRTVKYMFREDSVYGGFRPDASKVTVLKPGERYEDGILTVEAFGSTDIGNSYAVESQGRKVFHAGDLNAWLWLDESTEKEVREAREQYEKIVADIKSRYERFDLVMFPVDSRIGREYWWGAGYFVRQILTDLFVPMHFELADSEEELTKRHLDAGAFRHYANQDHGDCLLLTGTRSRYLSTR